MSSSIVKLNIGGTVFQTKMSTLTRFDGFFRTMLETGVPVEKDDSGAIFIDRNPKYFSLILDFLRDGHVTFPKKYEEIEEVMRDADFYALEELKELCKEAMAETLRVFESDSHLYQIFHYSKERTLIFHVPQSIMRIYQYLEAKELKEFLLKYQEQLNIYFCTRESGSHLNLEEVKRIGSMGNGQDFLWSFHYMDYQNVCSKTQLSQSFTKKIQKIAAGFTDRSYAEEIVEYVEKFLQDFPVD